MSENPRGEYVRRQESYDGLAQVSFGDLETHVLDTLCRVPTSHYMMRMTAPLVHSTHLSSHSTCAMPLLSYFDLKNPGGSP